MTSLPAAVGDPVVAAEPLRHADGSRRAPPTAISKAVRAAIAACGAAKYSWLGPARVGSAARDDLERASYARDTDAVSRLQRLTDLVALIAGWAASIPA